MQSVSSASPTNSRIIRTSDPELPRIIARAAIEFDEAARQKKGVKFVAAKELGDYLRSSFYDPARESTQKLNFSDSALHVIVSAFDSVPEYRQSNETVGDIVKTAWDIAKSIDAADKSDDIIQYKRLRAFCVALGNSLLAYREGAREKRPSRPYRS